MTHKNVNKAPNVRSLLAQYHAIHERQFKGDYDAVVTLVDLAEAITRAGLTDRQAQAIALVYGDDLTQADAGERLGVGQNTVSELLALGIAKIQRVYDKWALTDEGGTY
ncbi:sigma factor-like helix-turn-helix DNA-binding protein [Bacillus sp. FSL K6-3431]|uniref:sigma factor-like helix-turn-helix DNA-binding protein n=1 Tax=Bacillus sp. FSL K6-3431 TaxID=2921500 RepID=UPI0030F651DB